MVVRITVDRREWDIVKAIFAEAEVEVENVDNDSEDRVEITLPSVVSKEERHQIHKMTLKNMFEGTTYDKKYCEPYMIIKLSAKFVKSLGSGSGSSTKKAAVAPETVSVQDSQIDMDVIMREIREVLAKNLINLQVSASSPQRA